MKRIVYNIHMRLYDILYLVAVLILKPFRFFEKVFIQVHDHRRIEAMRSGTAIKCNTYAFSSVFYLVSFFLPVQCTR